MDNKLKEEFRKLVLDLDDHTTLKSIAEPVKGDIYFDGVEIEAWIDANFISRQELVEKIQANLKIDEDVVPPDELEQQYAQGYNLALEHVKILAQGVPNK